MNEYLLWNNPPHFDSSIDQPKPSLIHYPARGKNNACFIVCAGGAYLCRADQEGEPIAKWLQSLGISAFVLTYRYFPYSAPVPLTDLQRAIRYVRHNAEKLEIDPNRIGIIGFSAGGHLVSSATVHFDKHPSPSDEIDVVSCRPDISVLCYPVITMKDFGHGDTRTALIGNEPSNEDIEFYSSETQVTHDCPPCFIWHTFDDAVVPVRNSLCFAQAMRDADVECELHVFERGPHGLGLANENDIEAKSWPSLCENWLKYRGFL